MNNRQLVRNVMQKRAFQRGEHLHHLRNASFNQRQAGAREIFVNYIKNPLVRFKELPSRLIDEALEELFEITADELTEKVTEALREAQIDEHVSSLKKGSSLEIKNSSSLTVMNNLRLKKNSKKNSMTKIISQAISTDKKTLSVGV